MNALRGQRGFTLIELVVVMAILAILAAIAVPLITHYLGGARERAYDADRDAIQKAVDAYYFADDNTRYLGKRQYPIKGLDKTAGTFYEGDEGEVAGTVTINGNPLGGTIGGNPKWVDDDNDIRDGDEEILNDEDTASTVAGWHVVAVTWRAKTYYVDTRDYLIDMDELVSAGYLESVPKSASADNKTGATGSYSWYVNDKGRVHSLYYHLPESTSTGYQNVYP